MVGGSLVMPARMERADCVDKEKSESYIVQDTQLRGLVGDPGWFNIWDVDPVYPEAKVPETSLKVASGRREIPRCFARRDSFLAGGKMEPPFVEEGGMVFNEAAPGQSM